jgi:hypothetical protein
MDAKKKDEKFDFVGDEKDAGAGLGGGGSATTVVPPKPDGINVKSIEVAGIHIDSEGHEWTIPEKDNFDVRYRSKFEIPRPDPLMGYQFIRKEELTEMMGEQWVPVTREEIGVAVFKTEKDEYGDPLDRYHVVGTQICIKKPKILIDRQYAAQNRVCAAAVSATEPPPPGKDPKEQSARTGAQRGQRRYTLDRRTEKVTPKNVDNEQISGLE